MEGYSKDSLEFDDSVDTDDSKYICGLSTILVATIQELKDRISQVEFIFCSQIFPNFQSRSKNLQWRILEARKAAEDDWKKKEDSFLSQIEELRLEKQQSQEQIHQLNLSLEQSKTRLMSAEHILQNHEHEREKFLEKLEGLQKKEDLIAELKDQVGQKANELAKEKDLQRNLVQQLKLKDQQTLVQQCKLRSLNEELTERYKNLKSQYNFLLRKTGLFTHNSPYLDRIGKQKDLSRPYTNKRNIEDPGNEEQENMLLASKPSPLKTARFLGEKLGGNQSIGPVKDSSSHSPYDRSSSSISLPHKLNAGDKKYAVSDGEKGATSCWRNTRTHQEQGGADPHDDFLDTPMEIVRNLNKDGHEEVQDIPVPAPRDLDFNNSDDETQEISPEMLPNKKPISVLKPENKGFKYVEPVRKRADRENLKGVECKQCKKFYDAVLPNTGDKGSNSTMRCEHHDGVSRHRYRYVPPMTPEGFWNIGFDSER